MGVSGLLTGWLHLGMLGPRRHLFNDLEDATATVGIALAATDFSSAQDAFLEAVWPKAQKAPVQPWATQPSLRRPCWANLASMR